MNKLKLRVPKDIRQLYTIFKRNGKKLYIVGGAVRDAIFGKSPKDFDLATDAKPDEVLTIAKSNGFSTVEVGKTFGVVVVGGHEIATFRKDIGKGRRPNSVDYTDIKGDVLRRDLTINALFYDIGREEIVDLVGGISDLNQRKIRTVGNPLDRFSEDPLRKLRALRFQARIGGKLDSDLLYALKSDVSLIGVSEERIRDEFIKTLKTAIKPSKYLKILVQIGYMDLILPSLIISKPFVDTVDYILQLAIILRHNPIKKLTKQLNALSYTRNEITNVTFLISLLDFSSAKIYEYKRMQKNTTLSVRQILSFGSILGIDMTDFVNFELSVRGDAAPVGLRKSEIGNWIKRKETELFMR